MSNELAKPMQIDPAALANVLIAGDTSRLTQEQKAKYVLAVCDAVGVNIALKPFDFIRLNGKEQLYALKSCTDQLRTRNRINIQIVAREQVGDCYIVTARATTPEGRQDESTGAVGITNLKGDAMANAMMKAETKAKRRVTLSICGCGMLDECELETIPGAARGEPLRAEVKMKLLDAPADPVQELKDRFDAPPQQTVTDEQTGEVKPVEPSEAEQEAIRTSEDLRQKYEGAISMCGKIPDVMQIVQAIADEKGLMAPDKTSLGKTVRARIQELKGSTTKKGKAAA